MESPVYTIFTKIYEKIALFVKRKDHTNYGSKNGGI